MKKTRKMRAVRLSARLMVAAGTALLLLGCEQLFTFSVFSGLQRDPSNLPFEQQIAYAESALASGDKDKMAEAYDALSESLAEKNNDDADLNKLAADLAIGASGLNDVVGDLTEAALDGDFSSQSALADQLDSKLDSVDYSYIDEATAQIDAAEANGGSVSEEQYLMAAAGLLMKAGSEAGSIGSIDDTTDNEVEQFVNDAVAATGATDGPLVELQDLLNNQI